jgi:hypothetical protein
LGIQVNDDPTQIVFPEHIIGPNNRSDGFRATANAGDDVLPHIRIETFRALGRIMQPSDCESNSHSQADTVVADRFLQDDKASGVFLFIRNDTAKRDFTPEGIQRILRIEDGGFDPEHFELLQIAATGVSHADEC